MSDTTDDIVENLMAHIETVIDKVPVGDDKHDVLTGLLEALAVRYPGPGSEIHRATPSQLKPLYCLHCGQYIRQVPGGHGTTWVHDATGAVAAPSPPSR
jgi:hypothetical protein